MYSVKIELTVLGDKKQCRNFGVVGSDLDILRKASFIMAEMYCTNMDTKDKIIQIDERIENDGEWFDNNIEVFTMENGKLVVYDGLKESVEVNGAIRLKSPYYKNEITCPVCGGWISTVYTDSDDNVIMKTVSSDYEGENVPCRSCQAEMNGNKDEKEIS